VYIIDEVHMLSKPAFNALLKTLEEPPEHVVFILATTDLHKVPATIISRTQHFAFRSIGIADLIRQLRHIADSENMQVSDEALAAIAERGDGSFRNSISLLDQLSSFADSNEGITLELVESLLGLAGAASVATILRAIDERDVATVIQQLTELEQAGIQPTVLTDQIIQTLRKQLAENPAKVTLLDALLAVTLSPQPQLKLLTVLVGAIKPKATTVAAVVAAKPAIVIEAPAVTPRAQPKTQPTKAAPPVSPLVPDAEAVDTPLPKKKKSAGPITLDWSALIEETRTNHLALHSVLSKCTYELDGDTLTLYTGRKFSKTKLDDPKYLTKLQEALAVQGVVGLLVVTIPSNAPPADEKLAAIAAMMGGGQEVTLNE